MCHRSLVGGMGVSRAFGGCKLPPCQFSPTVGMPWQFKYLVSVPWGFNSEVENCWIIKMLYAWKSVSVWFFFVFSLSLFPPYRPPPGQRWMIALVHCIALMAVNVGSREQYKGMRPSQLGMGLGQREASGPFSLLTLKGLKWEMWGEDWASLWTF